jgi:hypothetical protein
MFLDIIHRLVFNKKRSCLYLKQNVSETGFCPRLQVKPTLLAQSIELVPISGNLCQLQDGIHKSLVQDLIRVQFQ